MDSAAVDPSSTGGRPAASDATPAPSFTAAVYSIFELHHKELNDLRLSMMKRLAESEAQSARFQVLHTQAVDNAAQRDAAHQLALAEAKRRTEAAESRATKYFTLYQKQASELRKLRKQSGSEEVSIESDETLVKENDRLNLLLAAEREAHATERAALVQALAADRERNARLSADYEQKTALIIDYKRRVAEGKLARNLGVKSAGARPAGDTAHPSSSESPAAQENVVQLAEPPCKSATASAKPAVRKISFDEHDSSGAANPPPKRRCSESPSRPPLRELAPENGRSSSPSQNSKPSSPSTPTPMPGERKRLLKEVVAAGRTADNAEPPHAKPAPDSIPRAFSPTLHPTLSLDDDVLLSNFERGFGFKDPADAGMSVLMPVAEYGDSLAGFEALEAGESDDDVELLASGPLTAKAANTTLASSATTRSAKPVPSKPDFFATPPSRPTAAKPRQPLQPASAPQPAQRKDNLLAMSSPPSQGDHDDDSIPPLPPPRTDGVFDRENHASPPPRLNSPDDLHDYLTPRPAKSGEWKRAAGGGGAASAAAAMTKTKLVSAVKKPPNTAPPATTAAAAKSAPQVRKKPVIEVVNLDSSDIEPIDGEEDADIGVSEEKSKVQTKTKPKPAPFSTYAAAEARKADAPQHQYHEVVRNKDARRMMHAVDCPCCRDFYAACGPIKPLPELGFPEGRGDRMQNVGRHRHIHKPPSTPPGFWDTGFPTTQEAVQLAKKPPRNK
ncbi:hypothetical protein BDZ88DRAFT_454333 [Geranomyces variabilis]|nr:hypothetical protein BDZ88DRAFT_454333 [Geranomyces variabilis]KAJ3136453.1 hypothetical protein HDU90_003163 [Geranomyces variabilis]